MIMMMAMMVGSVISVSGGLSTMVTLVNEKIIELGALDFLLIPGWGKEKTDGTGTGGGTPVTGSTYCIDTIINTCKSGDPFTTLHTVETHDTCVSTTKSECIANGGTMTSANGLYPKNCIAGSRVECVTLRGKDRGTCAQDYKKKCTDAGGDWAGSGGGGGNGGSGGNGGGGGGNGGDTRTAAEICSRYGTNGNHKGCGPGRSPYKGKCMTADDRAKCDADVARILGI
jgi:uncharacterized membrane protein YgcG